MLILWIPGSPYLSAQISLDSVFRSQPIEIRDIPEGITDIEVDQEGNILLLQTRKHKLHKYFRSTGYDSTLTIGGKSIRREGFNYPKQIGVPNRQEVYLLDNENRRIAILNINLKIVREINFLTLPISADLSDPDYFWPIAFAAGPSGELFLLNQEDIKVYKFNDMGQFERTFAGVDYGDGSMVEPELISINEKNYIFLADTVNQRVAVYDFYGIYQYDLNTPSPFRFQGMVTPFQFLILYDAERIWIRNTFSRKESLVRPELPGPIIDVAATGEYFYVLWEKGVNLYPIGGEPRK